MNDTTEETATITGDGVTANLNKVIEAVKHATKQSTIWDEYDGSKLYKCVVSYLTMKMEEERVTVYCRATSFEAAREIINRTTYIAEFKRHGHIVSIAETAGVWVE